MPEENEGQEAQPEASPPLSSFAQNFLTQVPEDERPYVQKYLPEWDKGFNKYSQEVQQELGGWKSLGDKEQIQRALGITNWIQRDPAGFVGWMQEKGYYNPEPPKSGTDDSDFDDLPPAVKEKLDKLDKLEPAMGQLYRQQMAFMQQQQEEAELAQLNSLLEQMKGSMKHFNERGVLGLLASGMNPEEAARTWDEMFETQTNPAPTRSTPPVLGSAGSAPVNLGQKRARELSDSQAKEAGVELLKAIMGTDK